ncbi:glycine--tRNA ligase subunit beta [Thermodesulfobacteriota bacterium]
MSNTKALDPGMVVRGNERVLRARLADAKFFYDLDRKRPLEERVEDLKGVVFQEKLGTSYDKVMRNMEVAESLSAMVAPEVAESIKRATLLSKADLVTEVVGEFPTLQGVMGGIYARESGDTEEVALAVREHYLPLGGGGELPESVTGAVVGIADRIETLAGYFGIGSVPSGTADPYGLRRRALGTIRIVLKFRFRISLRDLMDVALKGLSGVIDADTDGIGDQLREFIILRFKNLLIAEGSPYDVVEAVLAVQNDDLTDAVDRVRAIADVRDSENFEPLMIACKRIINIVGDATDRNVNASSFVEDQERDLFEAFGKQNEKVTEALSGKDYQIAMEALAELKGPVDAFFDHVMVMDKDPELQRNRLALLLNLADMFGKIADLTNISE